MAVRHFGPPQEEPILTTYSDEMTCHKLTFDSTKWPILQSVLNEVLHGFAIENFESTIGKDREGLRHLLVQFGHARRGRAIELDLSQTIALRNALRETLQELGIEEFRIRTGYDFEQGEEFLRELNDLISGSAQT